MAIHASLGITVRKPTAKPPAARPAAFKPAAKPTPARPAARPTPARPTVKPTARATPAAFKPTTKAPFKPTGFRPTSKAMPKLPAKGVPTAKPTAKIVFPTRTAQQAVEPSLEPSEVVSVSPEVAYAEAGGAVFGPAEYSQPVCPSEDDDIARGEAPEDEPLVDGSQCLMDAQAAVAGRANDRAPAPTMTGSAANSVMQASAAADMQPEAPAMSASVDMEAPVVQEVPATAAPSAQAPTSGKPAKEGGRGWLYALAAVGTLLILSRRKG